MTNETPTAAAVRTAGEKYVLWISVIRLTGVVHAGAMNTYYDARKEAVRAVCELNSEEPGCVRWDCAERIRTADPRSEESYSICEDPEHAQPWEPKNLNDYQQAFIDRLIMREAVEVAAAALNIEARARMSV